MRLAAKVNRRFIMKDSVSFSCYIRFLIAKASVLHMSVCGMHFLMKEFLGYDWSMNISIGYHFDSPKRQSLLVSYSNSIIIVHSHH